MIIMATMFCLQCPAAAQALCLYQFVLHEESKERMVLQQGMTISAHVNEGTTDWVTHCAVTGARAPIGLSRNSFHYRSRLFQLF